MDQETRDLMKLIEEHLRSIASSLSKLANRHG